MTVLRDGRVVAEAPLEEMPKERVVAAMVGDAARAAGERTREPSAGAAPARGRRRCEVRGLRSRARSSGCQPSRSPPANASGLAGLAGSGKDQIGDAIAGLRHAAGAGEIWSTARRCAAAM